LLLGIAFLPVVASACRSLTGHGWAFTSPLVQHLTLVLAFLGAWLAAREGKLLRLASGELWKNTKVRPWIEGGTAIVSAFVCGLLAFATYDFVLLERELGSTISDLMVSWPLLLAMPTGFLSVGAYLAWKNELPGLRGWFGRGLSLAALAGGWFAGVEEGLFYGEPVGILVGVLLLAALLGAPLFVPLGGIPLLLFLSQEIPSMAVSIEMNRLATQPFLPAIPMFTLVGFLLTEGRAPERMLRFFRAFFGWLPGGTAVIATLLCAFFSIFTGGSGVTILALGGLLFHTLKSEGYRTSFALGLMTGSGSLGILLPPALPLILFGIAANVPIDELFVAGILPGALMILLVCLWGARAGVVSKVERTRFDLREARNAFWEAKFELAAPVIAMMALFSGRATLVETSALTAVYVLCTQLFVHRDVSLSSSLWTVLRKCVAVLGGILIILCCAQGLSNYLVDAEIPMRVLEWLRGTIDSPLAFLLCLNLFLLAVGCLLDIYSATFVVVPLILPLSRAYGIDPIHLGILFVANLELGYLTPPVGLNLFLASYRFERPLFAIAKSTLPIFAILAIGVLVITYVPWLTTAFR